MPGHQQLKSREILAFLEFRRLIRCHGRSFVHYLNLSSLKRTLLFYCYLVFQIKEFDIRIRLIDSRETCVLGRNYEIIVIGKSDVVARSTVAQTNLIIL
jgi:hypothetical protein